MTFNTEAIDFVYIELSRIIFDEKVADMVEKRGEVFPKDLCRNLIDCGTFPLTDDRLESVIDGYKKGLPPISVKKILGDKYMLMNGRHRIAAVIINGQNIIPCRIIEE